MSDNVNKPAHYNQGEIETIDGIRAALGEGFAAYCRGNVLKYVWRCGKKGDAVEDLKKAAKYLEWAIEAMQGNCPAIPDSSSRKPLEIPSGWRELEPDEVPLATDMHEWMGGWFYRKCDATNEYKWHSSRHIRKIEPANPSETPNSSTWIPKVGDKVLVVDESREAVIEHIGGSYQLRSFDYPFLVKHTHGGYRRCRLDNLQLIEAAQ